MAAVAGLRGGLACGGPGGVAAVVGRGGSPGAVAGWVAPVARLGACGAVWGRGGLRWGGLRLGRSKAPTVAVGALRGLGAGAGLLR